MGHLRLSLLGSFRITLDGQPIVGFKSARERALLAYLAVESNRPHSREKLAALLWPDWPDQSALRNLRYSLSNLRRVLREPQAETPFLLVSRDQLQFNASSDHWLDVAAFAELTEAGATRPPDPKRLEEAVALCQGAFLEGFSVADSAPFEDWVSVTRERLGRELRSALELLAGSYEKEGEYERAESYARRLLALEPYDETAHRQVMRILALSGRRTAALTQYEACRRLLVEELNLEPSRETAELFERIRAGGFGPPVEASSPQVQAAVELPAFLRKAAPATEQPVFVAREGELAQLESLLTQVMSGQGRIAFVTGEAGSGKTALLQAFARRAEDSNPSLVAVMGNCNAYTGIGDPYLPFREVLELLTGDVEARLAAGTIAAETARRLWGLIPAALPILVESGPDLVGTFLSQAALRASRRFDRFKGARWQNRLETLLTAGSPSIFERATMQQTDLFEQYTRVLQGIAEQAPLLVLIDDLQWADPGSISLLFHLGRRLVGARLLLVGAYRPEEVALEPEGKRHPLAAVVNELSRDFGDIMINLDRAEGEHFVEAFLASEPNRFGRPFRDMLWRQTRGNPLFTIELLRGLQDQGDVAQDAEGFWVEGPSLDWESLPARVEAVIRERISRLPEDLRRVLAAASVEGEEFTAEVVGQALMTNEVEVLERLSADLDQKHRIVRAHIMRRVQGKAVSRFRFRHILFQKYVYGSLDPVERAQLHERVGNSLEEYFSAQEDVPTVSAELARHFQQAGMAEKAIRYLQRAGDAAARLAAYSEAHAHLDRALQILQEMPDSRGRNELEVSLQLSLARASRADIAGTVWQGAIARARELCRRLGNAAELSEVLGEQATFHYVQAEYETARQIGEEALSVAEEAGDPLLVALRHWVLGFVRFGAGEYVESRVHLRHVLELYEPQRDHRSLMLHHGLDAGLSAMAYDACCLWSLGYPDQAVSLSRKALALAREFGDRFTLADVLCYGGCLLDRMRRNTASQREHAEELLQITGDVLPSYAWGAIAFRGDMLARSGSAKQGIQQMRDALAVWHSRGALISMSQVLASLAAAQGLTGDAEEGLSTLAQGFEFLESSGERYWEPELHRQKAELLLAQGDETAAEASLNAAIEVARRQQAKSWELRAVVGLCRLWNGQGRRVEARQRLEEIYAWFTEGFDSLDLREARTLLQELRD
jgi:DNA-binding SARP family transcriptional activator